MSQWGIYGQTVNKRLVLRALYLHALLPADPQVSTCEEAGHGVARQVVDPPLLPQLGHDGVDPGEACPAFSPLGQCLWVAFPWDLYAYGVAFHLVEAWVVGGGCVEELAPQQLAVEWERWQAVLLHLRDAGRKGRPPGLAWLQKWLESGMSNSELRIWLVSVLSLYNGDTSFYLLVQVSEFEVEESAGEAAKPQVRTEASRTSQQWVGVHSGTLKVGHPCLYWISDY